MQRESCSPSIPFILLPFHPDIAWPAKLFVECARPPSFGRIGRVFRDEFQCLQARYVTIRLPIDHWDTSADCRARSIAPSNRHACSGQSQNHSEPIWIRCVSRRRQRWKRTADRPCSLRPSQRCAGIAKLAFSGILCDSSIVCDKTKSFPPAIRRRGLLFFRIARACARRAACLPDRACAFRG